MPELPEVQTIVNDLNKKVIGEKIVVFWSEWKKNVRPSFLKFKKEIIGAKIIGVRRIGKQIVVDLNNDNSILIHLKMSGQLLFKKLITLNSNKKLKKCFESGAGGYVRHEFIFESMNILEFSDLRKFGWLGVVKTKEVENTKEIKKLGIDALAKDFNLERFKKILAENKKKIIGVILLDQNLVAGIGNIYRSEILFEAGINPKRKIETLNIIEIKKIFKAIGNILKKAVKMRGTSDSDYFDTDGKKGNFQNFLKVYGRAGLKCFICQNFVSREKLNQRSIFYCSYCQK